MLIIADFATRLVCGLAVVMLLTSTSKVGVAYFRTIMQVALGFSVLAALAAWGHVPTWMLVMTPIAATLGFMGWTLGRRAFGQICSATLFLLSTCTLVAICQSLTSSSQNWFVLANAFSSAALLGTMMSAMLLGHSYLIAPTMSIDPLLRMVQLITSSLLVRLVVAGLLVAVVLGWIGGSVTEPPKRFWWFMLLARWGLGLIGPAVVALLVWQTAKLKSTQSATGILYVGVILTFFGELISQVMGLPLNIQGA